MRAILPRTTDVEGGEDGSETSTNNSPTNRFGTASDPADPVEIKVRGTRMVLRRDECQNIKVAGAK